MIVEAQYEVLGKCVKKMCPSRKRKGRSNAQLLVRLLLRERSIKSVRAKRQRDAPQNSRKGAHSQEVVVAVSQAA
jgi:hypothetical protein